MQRMSDMLTRWLDGSIRRRGEEQEGGAAPPAEGEGGNPQPEQERGAAPLAEGEGGNPQPEQERGAAPLAEGEGGNPQPEQEAADQPALPAAQAIDASLPDTSLPPAQSRDTSLPAAQSGDLPAQQEASPVAQGPEPGRGGGGTLGEVPTVRGEDGGGELLLCDEDGRGTLDGGGLTEGVQGSCEEPRVAGGREVAMDSGCERDRTAADRPEEVGARAEGHCSRALRESEEAQPAPSRKQSETACDSAACMSDAPVAAVSGSGSESASHVSRSVISQPPQTATSHITASSDSCAQSSSAPCDDSRVQSEGEEAAQTWPESVDLSGPGVGMGSDDPRPASSLQHSAVPQPPPHTGCAQEPLTDPHTGLDSSTVPALDVPPGSGGGGHNCSLGMATSASAGVAGQGVTAAGTRLEPVISLHYSQQGQCSGSSSTCRHGLHCRKFRQANEKLSSVFCL